MIMEMDPEEREAVYRTVRGEKTALWVEVLDVCRAKESDAALVRELGPPSRIATTTAVPLPIEKKGRKRAKKEKPGKKGTAKIPADAVRPAPVTTPAAPAPSTKP
jgi:hypothetical protein